MRYGIDVAIIGGLAGPAHLVTLAREAEAAGREAVVVRDHLAFARGVPSADPWAAPAAQAGEVRRHRAAGGGFDVAVMG